MYITQMESEILALPVFGVALTVAGYQLGEWLIRFGAPAGTEIVLAVVVALGCVGAVVWRVRWELARDAADAPGHAHGRRFHGHAHGAPHAH